MIGAALLVVVTGVARGILFGRITTLEALSSPYGFGVAGVDSGNSDRLRNRRSSHRAGGSQPRPRERYVA